MVNTFLWSLGSAFVSNWSSTTKLSMPTKPGKNPLPIGWHRLKIKEFVHESSGESIALSKVISETIATSLAVKASGNFGLILVPDIECTMLRTEQPLFCYFVPVRRNPKIAISKKRLPTGAIIKNRKAMSKSYRKWDEVTAAFLSDPEDARIFLIDALEAYQEDGDQAAFLQCLRQVVEAQMGFTELSRRTGKSRQHLYEALSANGNPRLDTMLAILSAVGVLQKEAA